MKDSLIGNKYENERKNLILKIFNNSNSIENAHEMNRILDSEFARDEVLYGSKDRSSRTPKQWQARRDYIKLSDELQFPIKEEIHEVSSFSSSADSESQSEALSKESLLRVISQVRDQYIDLCKSFGLEETEATHLTTQILGNAFSPSAFISSDTSLLASQISAVNEQFIKIKELALNTCELLQDFYSISEEEAKEIVSRDFVADFSKGNVVNLLSWFSNYNSNQENILDQTLENTKSNSSESSRATAILEWKNAHSKPNSKTTSRIATTEFPQSIEPSNYSSSTTRSYDPEGRTNEVIDQHQYTRKAVTFNPATEMQQKAMEEWRDYKQTSKKRTATAAELNSNTQSLLENLVLKIPRKNDSPQRPKR